MLIILIKAYCVNVVVDIKPIYLNKRYLFQNKIYYLDKGITKPCTHLHPAPSSSIDFHPAHFSLQPALCYTLNNIWNKILQVIGQFPQI